MFIRVGCFCLLFIGLFSQLKAQQLEIKVVQDGKVLTPMDGEYQLTRSSFSFQLKGDDLEGFLVGITTDEAIYQSALGKADLEVMWFEQTGMAEYLFNEKKNVFVSDEAPSYWYFTAEDDHRFDKGATGSANSWEAVRTVNSFYFMNPKKHVSLQKINMPVFLFFYTAIYDDSYKVIDIKPLHYIKLAWK